MTGGAEVTTNISKPGTRPRWRRRSQARPGEIVEAALAVFSEKGFAAARLDDIAARAGVSKGALYLYFETKQALFEAVVRETIAPRLAIVEGAVVQDDPAFGVMVRALFSSLADEVAQRRLGAVLKMVVSESGNFPDLARVWRREVVDRVLNAIAAAVTKAQARGEVRPGDARLMVFSVAGPLLMGVLWQEVLVPVGAEPIDLRALLAQHAEVIILGLLTRDATALTSLSG